MKRFQTFSRWFCLFWYKFPLNLVYSILNIFKIFCKIQNRNNEQAAQFETEFNCVGLTCFHYFFELSDQCHNVRHFPGSHRKINQSAQFCGRCIKWISNVSDGLRLKQTKCSCQSESQCEVAENEPISQIECWPLPILRVNTQHSISVLKLLKQFHRCNDKGQTQTSSMKAYLRIVYLESSGILLKI